MKNLKEFLSTREERYWKVCQKIYDARYKRIKVSFTEPESILLSEILKGHDMEKSMTPLPKVASKLSKDLNEEYSTCYLLLIRNIYCRNIPYLKVGGRYFLPNKFKIRYFSENVLVVMEGKSSRNDDLNEDKIFEPIAEQMKLNGICPNTELMRVKYDMSGYQANLFMKYWEKNVKE